MTPAELRHAARLLQYGVRPPAQAMVKIGEALEAWLEDPHGVGFEVFLSIRRKCEVQSPTTVRDQLLREYSRSLPDLSNLKAAELILDQFEECRYSRRRATDFGPIFATLFKHSHLMRLPFPSVDRLRRIIE